MLILCLACQTHLSDITDKIKGMSIAGNTTLVELGRRIRELRKGHGWTQTDMAVYLDMNRGHLSDIETGKREAGIITLQIIARGLEISMSKLLKNL